MKDIASAKSIADRVIEQVRDYYVGDILLMTKILATMLAGGHILFEDYPGLGKTLLVKLFAKALGCSFSRVQFTPDMLPADITGTRVWQPGNDTFVTMPGPIFTQFLLADEINRATPKTQSALLEAMEEKQVTIEGETRRLPVPFLVLATQNPIEMEGTYPLPEAQLDRFSMRLSLGYPASLKEESLVMQRRLNWQTNDPSTSVTPVINPTAFCDLQALVEKTVYVDQTIMDYIGEIVRHTRVHPSVEVGVSPRGALALMNVARTIALIGGLDFVTPDHVKLIASDVLSHRIVLKLEYALENYPVKAVVEESVKAVPVPTDFRRSPV